MTDPLGPLIAAAYERQIVSMLQAEPMWRQFLGPPSPPAPWRKRQWRKARTKMRNARTSFGMWIGGLEPHDCWDC